jgi:hypothetical protein
LKVKETLSRFPFSPVKQSATFHLGCLCSYSSLRSDSSLYLYLGSFTFARCRISNLQYLLSASVTVTDSSVGGLVANHILSRLQTDLFDHHCQSSASTASPSSSSSTTATIIIIPIQGGIPQYLLPLLVLLLSSSASLLSYHQISPLSPDSCASFLFFSFLCQLLRSVPLDPCGPLPL